MDIQKMIEKGEAQIQEQERRDTDEREKNHARYLAMIAGIYEKVESMLPEALREYLDKSEMYPHQPIYNSLTILEDGKYVNNFVANDYQNMLLDIPECAPIRFRARIDEHPRLDRFLVYEAQMGDEPYYSEYHDETFNDLYVALAMASREYQKFAKFKADIQAGKETPVPVQPGKDDEEMPTDYLQAALDQFNQGRCLENPEHLYGAATALALIGILDQMKQGTVLSQLDEIESSVRIWGGIDMGEDTGTSK